MLLKKLNTTKAAMHEQTKHKVKQKKTTRASTIAPFSATWQWLSCTTSCQEMDWVYAYSSRVCTWAFL